MTDPKRRAGSIILLLLIAVAAGAGFFAFKSTGPKGIEERFEDAVGITGNQGVPGEQSDADGTGTGQHFPREEGGFTLEGSPALYGIVLALLIAACILAYRKFWNG